MEREREYIFFLATQSVLNDDYYPYIHTTRRERKEEYLPPFFLSPSLPKPYVSANLLTFGSEPILYGTRSRDVYGKRKKER